MPRGVRNKMQSGCKFSNIYQIQNVKFQKIIADCVANFLYSTDLT